MPMALSDRSLHPHAGTETCAGEGAPTEEDDPEPPGVVDQQALEGSHPAHRLDAERLDATLHDRPLPVADGGDGSRPVGSERRPVIPRNWPARRDARPSPVGADGDPVGGHWPGGAAAREMEG